MNKKVFIILLSLLFISGTFLFLYHNYQKNKINDNAKLVYNSEFNKWEEVPDLKNPISQTEREEILKSDDNQSGIHNKTVLKGYFDHYDEANQELIIKSSIVYTQGLFETTKLKLLENQIIHCAPEIYIDPNNGVSHYLKEMIIPVKTGSTLWFPTERTIPFEDLVQKSTETTFLFIQLTQDYNSERENYIKKLIAVGLCE